MTLTLTRTEFRPDGVFSELKNDKYKVLAHTLEHAYQINDNWLPKIPDGTYQCIRGQHRLEGMAQDFETFEVTGVTGHTSILFHTGNWNNDSKGCILLGEGLAPSSKGLMITASKLAFKEFMALLDGENSFELVVIS